MNKKILFNIIYGVIILAVLTSLWLSACLVIKYLMNTLLGF